MSKTISLPLLPHFQKFITASKNGKRAKYGYRKLATGTIEQYTCVYRLLKEFEEKHQKPITIEVFQKATAATLLREKKFWNRFYKDLLHFFYKDKGHFDSYVGSVLKVLRTFFNYLKEEKHYAISSYCKSFQQRIEPFTPLVLQPEQLQFLIHDKDFEQSLPGHLKRTKDLFVVGCTVALRYSDLMRLKKDQLIDSPEEKHLLLHAKKTAKEVRLPLPSYLLSIIGKYRKMSGRYLLPQLSSTNLNLQVKELAQRAGWTYALPKVRFQKGKPVELKNQKGGCLRFCDQVTTHTMRRTAITTLLTLEVPEMVVRRISGHAPNSKEFYRYVVIAQQYLNKHVLKAYQILQKNAESEV